jgi:hypothetical protein
MTWLKPSFAWMLYRAKYGTKPGMERVLRIKLTHQVVAEILSCCRLQRSSKTASIDNKSLSGSVSGAIVQWDPERDLFGMGEKSERNLPGDIRLVDRVTLFKCTLVAAPPATSTTQEGAATLLL